MTASGRAAVVFVGFLYALSGGATPAPTWAAAPEPPATLGTAPEDQGRVREAQALLADLDLWEAPPDGLADAAFRRAVQVFQRQVGQAPTGSLDDATLRTLRTRADTARTARRLDAARAEEAAEARAAVAADPVLSARLAPQADDARADAGRDLGPCRTAPTAACLLREARETAKGIVDAELRDWALADIAAGLALAEGPEAVWPVLRLAADPRAVFTGLRRVAVALADAGRAAEAATVARTAAILPREGLRTWSAVAEALVRRAPAEALAGRAPAEAVAAEDAAEALLARVADVGERRAALAALARAAHARGASDLAVARLERAEGLDDLGRERAALVAAAWAAVGHPDRAAEALAAIGGDPDRTPVLVEMAAAHAGAGGASAALAAARAVPEARYRAVALADTGALLAAPEVVGEAEAVAAEIELPFAAAFAWSRIAEAWRVLGRADEAAAAARRIGDDALRVEALHRLARAGTMPPDRAAGLAAEAEAQRSRMLDRVARVRLGAQRAVALAQAGDADAGVAVRAVVEEALAVRNPWNRARVLVAAANAVAAAAAQGVEVAPPPAAGNR